jgi:hypothetical protein
MGRRKEGKEGKREGKGRGEGDTYNRWSARVQDAE